MVSNPTVDDKSVSDLHIICITSLWHCWVIDFLPGYVCKCSTSFSGTHCEVKISPCDSNPCLYGGTCIQNNLDYYCKCRGQYSGQRYCTFNVLYKWNVDYIISQWDRITICPKLSVWPQVSDRSLLQGESMPKWWTVYRQSWWTHLWVWVGIQRRKVCCCYYQPLEHIVGVSLRMFDRAFCFLGAWSMLTSVWTGLASMTAAVSTHMDLLTVLAWWDSAGDCVR